ncbi:DUF4446 family protein [Desulforamulus ferrireducens]|uniref:DUF4446 family protein n=1 Tax=Desulforamulus ferrireducens TaxID=1833852 RepID=A0A1S6ISJ8_9FIRM|nr:DUF4446 family protein [Desulforamulus ferrireducens]AQS57748.1 hypothetical protein B0537_00590 [Desulforamulus ferrireducens]
MNNIFQVIQVNSALIILVLIILVILLLLAQFILYRRFKEVSRRYKLLTRGPNGADLEQILQQYAGDVKKLEKGEEELRVQQERLKEQVAECVHNLGLVRFNAFDNMGSDLSFSLAMLDRRGDGVVLTGLYGRDETRLYAKPIRKGTSDYSLTQEEIKAVQISLEKI